MPGKETFRIIPPVSVLILFSTLALMGAFSCDTPQQGNNASGGRNLPSGSLDTLKLQSLRVTANTAYTAILDDLDRNDPASIDKAVRLFANTRADSVSRDSMLLTLNEFMISVAQAYYDAKILGNQKLAELFSNKEDQTEAAKVTGYLASHGISLAFRQGEFYLEPDDQFVLSQLKKVLTAGSRDWLVTKTSLLHDDAGGTSRVRSVPDSLAFRITVWEDFLKRNPDYLMNEAIRAEYTGLLSAYLTGTEDLPLFDPDTRFLQVPYKESYLRFLRDNPQRESAGIVKKFYNLLEKNGFKYNEAMDTFLSDVNLIPSSTE